MYSIDGFVFNLQLAHGSSTEKLGGFSNLTELYTSIAKAFNIEMSEV